MSSISIPEDEPLVPPQPKRRGRKPKPIQNRNWQLPRPIQRKEESHPRAKQLAVVMFMYHHQVFDPSSSWSVNGYRKPFQREAADYFKIKRRTIGNWVLKDWDNPEITNRCYLPRWPQLEKQLFHDFMELRKNGRPVTTAWARKRAIEIFTESLLSKEHVKLFTFSNGWWQGFKSRFNIVKRRVTKQATQQPEALAEGAKSVPVKTPRSGWDKRKATLILYIFGDGICRLQPTLIFHGESGEKSRISKAEQHLYAPGIKVIYNTHAYNNEELFKLWVEEDLPTVKAETRDFLLVMDAVAFHLSPPVKDAVCKQNITTALVPVGCTGMLQPLDTAVNKLIKDWIREFILDYELEQERKGKTRWSVSDRRIMTTWVIARAFERLKTKKDLIEKAFLDVGITVRPDGSQDNLIRIKGIDEIDFTGWETASEITIKSQELVSRLCDEEELSFGPEDELDEDILIYSLKKMTIPQLKQLASRNSLTVKGRKDDIVEQLQQYYAKERSQNDCITVQIDVEEDVFTVD
ncbi:hypothetical protein FOFC_15662 [Fusarium oxysporum]|nr:hypothetical protein FOFC_15662 [Fusarium oxysporum]